MAIRPEPPTDRDTGLYDVAIRAMAIHGDNRPRIHETIWQIVQNDHSLTLALLESFRRTAIDALLHRVETEIMSQERKTLTAEEDRAAMVVGAWRRADEDDLAEIRRQEKAANDLSMQQFQREMEAWRATAAGSFTINQKPFWQASVAEAIAVSRELHGDARFIDLLIAGLPNDGRPIEYYRKPSEIDALWKQAHNT